MILFPQDKTVGVFRGFSEGGFEFHADIVLPYKRDFQNAPMHGQFLAAQLENDSEGVLGRITAISSSGRLSSGDGDDYAIRAMAENRTIEENLREQYLKYSVNIRVLGVVRVVDGKIIFVASHRRLPHVGSKVAFLGDDVLREIAGHNNDGAAIGFLAMGEFVFGADDAQSGVSNKLTLKPDERLRIQTPRVVPKFAVEHLISRRSFVFARAGFGKSNLVKLLFSNLYKGEEPPAVTKRGNRKVPVGSLIFDPDGEYFWPDDKGRPGLCDEPALKDKVVVFTPKEPPSNFYGSFVAGGVKLDIRRLHPRSVVSIALSPDRQDQRNVQKIKQLSPMQWAEVVDAIHRDGYNTDEGLLRKHLGLDKQQDAELLAARANLTIIVQMLHDPSSQLTDKLMKALRKGKICIVDISQMRGSAGLALSGIILQKIFSHNQEEFTKKDSATIPTIAVLEEAQSVLGQGVTGGEGPYVSWVKEGRKYDLGALLVTQQPGSISGEILSQGDNWFVFHLLSTADLMAVKRANAHFGDDILSTLLNETIPGHGVFWSSVGGKSYPVPVRVLLFEEQCKMLDENYSRQAEDTYASRLKKGFDAENAAALSDDTQDKGRGAEASAEEGDTADEGGEGDYLKAHRQKAIKTFCAKSQDVIKQIKNKGCPWMGVVKALEALLPESMEDRNKVAHYAVPDALDEAFGKDKWDRETRDSKSKPGGTTLWVVKKKN